MMTDEMNVSPTARRRLTRPIALAASIAFLGAAGLLATGVAMAQSTPSPSATAEQGPDENLRERLRDGFRGGPLGRSHGPGMMSGRSGMMGGHVAMGPGLHGEFTTPDGDGGYRTLVMQRGEVTAVSSDSLTVRSEDGYRSTYVLNGDTSVNSGRDGIDDVAVGHQVHVMALRENGTDTAVRVADLTRMRAAGERFGFGVDGVDGDVADET